MLFRLSEALNGDDDQEHSVISLTDYGKLGPILTSKGVSVTALGMRNILDVPRVSYKLWQIFRLRKPDIVQTWMYHADLIGGIVARFSGIKNIIWGVRSTNIHRGVSKVTRGIRILCVFFSYVIPKLIVCAAEASRKAHVRIGYSQRRMTVIPNGFDTKLLTATLEDRMQIRTAAGFSESDLVVGSLGRYNPAKDHDNFITAAAFLAKDYPNLKFLLVGRELDLENEVVMKRIRETGYSDRFVLLGERHDVARCLKAMDIFCLHSQTEGFPNVLGEAMTMGLPCVTTDVGDASFLIGDTGTVVEPHNALALAEALRYLVVAGETFRLDLGKKAQRRIHENFTMSCVKLRFKSLYDHLSLDDS